MHVLALSVAICRIVLSSLPRILEGLGFRVAKPFTICLPLSSCSLSGEGDSFNLCGSGRLLRNGICTFSVVLLKRNS